MQSLECTGICTCCDKKRSETAKSKPKTFCSGDLVPSSARKIHKETSQERDTHLIIVDETTRKHGWVMLQCLQGLLCLSIPGILFILQLPTPDVESGSVSLSDWCCASAKRSSKNRLLCNMSGKKLGTCWEQIAGRKSKKRSITSLKMSW